MRLIESLDELLTHKSEIPTILTIGTFDGIHRAHDKLLREASEMARERKCHAAVITFKNHPREIVGKNGAPPLLTPWNRKARLFGEYELDLLVGLSFDRRLASITAEEFVRDFLVQRLNASVIISGPDFHFGAGGTGSPQKLEEWSALYNYQYIRDEPMLLNGDKVSSTRIRKLLLEGEVAGATFLLGRPHSNEGIVVEGDRIGRTIGWPTANLEIAAGELIPSDGVYAVWVTLADGMTYAGMMNIGTRPTVNGTSHRKEVHLIDFSGDLLGSSVTVEYMSRLRSEKRFGGLDDLKNQLANDRHAALEALSQ